jgi:glutamate racemase
LIGVFDSGYGGLTILRELEKLLPEYDFLYLGDNARSPYGGRSYETIHRYTLEAVKALFDHGCPLVILACNTASARALRTIQQKDLPGLNPQNRVLGIIRPCVEKLGEYSLSGHVGILGTEGTVNSLSYPIELKNLQPGLTVAQEACPMWVPLVENMELKGSGTRYFVRKHIDRILNSDPLIDTLVMACTHYPLLENIIAANTPKSIKLVSQGPLVAESLKDYLSRHPEMDEKLSKLGKRRFLTTESLENFEEKASYFYGKTLNASHIELS